MKLKAIILSLTCFIAGAAFSQTTPTIPTTSAAAAVPTQQFPMLGSRAALRAYALTLAADVDTTLYSSSSSESVYDYRTWVGQKSATEMLDYIKNLKLNLDTVDPTQTFYVYVGVRTATGEGLFYGYNQAQPVQVNGKWTLPKEIGNVVLRMSTIPVKVDKQVAYAMIIAKDSNGNTNYYELSVSGNTIYFAGDSAGLANAYVRISYWDGTTVSYDLGNDGKIKVTSPISATLAASFSDVLSFKDPTSKIAVVVQSDHGQGTVPTIELTSSTAASYTVDVQTSDAKKPKFLWIKFGSGGWSAVPVVSTGVQTISMPPGIMYIVPEFSPSDFMEQLYPVQTGGSGKG